MTITFACGHTAQIGDNPSSAPICGCGERQIQGVQARAPRFTGACTGPYATFANLGPATVNLAPGGSLPLAPAKD